MKYAFFFDFDGTLVDSERLSRRVWDDVWRGVTQTALPEDVYPRMTGKTYEQRAQHLIDLYQPALSADALCQLATERFEVLANSDGLPLMPGAREALERARASGSSVALVSNADRLYIDHMLSKLDLASFFETILTKEDAAQPKPAPDLYLELVRRYSDHQYIAIEDSSPGIASARGADVPVLGVIGAGSAEEVAGATHILTSLEEFDPQTILSLFYPHV